MSNASTRYVARFSLPEQIERGRDELVRCEVYLDDLLAAPVSGTLTVRDGSGVVRVNAAAVTVTNSVATYTIPAAVCASLSFGIGWAFEWRLTMPDGIVHLFRNDGALVRARLYPTITGKDIGRRLRALDPSQPAVITTRTSFAPDIDEADIELQNRLISTGKRPWLIATPSALRNVWIDLTLAIVFEGLAAQNPQQWLPVAQQWRARYEEAYSAASVSFDYDEDGTVTAPEEREPVRQGAIWSC